MCSSDRLTEVIPLKVWLAQETAAVLRIQTSSCGTLLQRSMGAVLLSVKGRTFLD